MGILTIKGNKGLLETIAKENRLRASKYGLEISLEEEKPLKKSTTKTKAKKEKSE